MSPDPSLLDFADLGNPQSLNLYQYALNNPLKYVDPTGLDQCIWDDGTRDDRPADGGAAENECGAQGGNWASNTDNSVTVNTIIHDQIALDMSNQVQYKITNDFSHRDAPSNPCVYMGRALPPSAYASAGKAASNNPVTSTLDLTKGFKIGGYLDAQPLASGNVYDRAAYGNYVYGVYMAAAGFPLTVTLAGADGIAAIHKLSNPNQYNGRQMDGTWGSLPAANVANISAGYNAQRSGATCHN